nr:lisH domain-containing protein FOPNL-like isoform X2 [Odocoileus virginianus texanus]
MATVAELKAVLKDTLEKRGVLRHLKARVRAEVFSALDDESEPQPSLSHENFLINELIREYLEFNKYKYTASVLIAESDHLWKEQGRGTDTENLHTSASVNR